MIDEADFLIVGNESRGSSLQVESELFSHQYSVDFIINTKFPRTTFNGRRQKSSKLSLSVQFGPTTYRSLTEIVPF